MPQRLLFGFCSKNILLFPLCSHRTSFRLWDSSLRWLVYVRVAAKTRHLRKASFLLFFLKVEHGVGEWEWVKAKENNFSSSRATFITTLHIRRPMKSDSRPIRSDSSRELFTRKLCFRDNLSKGKSSSHSTAVGWLSVVLIIDDVGELMWHSQLNIITPTFSILAPQ